MVYFFVKFYFFCMFIFVVSVDMIVYSIIYENGQIEGEVAVSTRNKIEGVYNN